MRLEEIIKDIPDLRLSGNSAVPIGAVSNDSRRVGKGALFFAFAGQKADGNEFIRSALEKGAAAVASDHPAPPWFAAEFPGAAWVSAPDLLPAFSKAAAAFHGHPSRDFALIGVTGTKGKTTTSWILENIYALAGANPGLVGTISHRAAGRTIAKAENTTPPPHELHGLFRIMSDAGASTVIMEVSSHALALHRADEAAFDTAVFTNLQHDHLDFHKNRENYFRAKLKLFELLAASPKKDKSAVLNADDERTEEILKALRPGIRPLTYGVDRTADLTAEKIELLRDRTVFELRAAGTVRRTAIQLPGRHNVYNALAAIAAAFSRGVPLETAAKGAETLASVPGRLERVVKDRPFSVFVDYAHTETALSNVLSTLAAMPHKRIITVFGCGGDRDRTKRAPMGSTAAAMSSQVIVTSDNPRSEDPAVILADIEEGLRGKFSNYSLIPDRRTAIFEAINRARPGDIVLIAGKGHEDYQILKTGTVHFDDRETAAEALEKWT